MINIVIFEAQHCEIGPPAAADAAQLIIVMAGDVRAKREIAYLFVPAIAKKVVDLGGNVEKGQCLIIDF